MECSKPAEVGVSPLRLSGVTPGERENLSFHRASHPAFRADLLAQSQTRWSIPLFRKPPNPAFLDLLAQSFLAGGQDAEEIKQNAAKILGHSWRWLGPVARRYTEKFRSQTRPRRTSVVDFLLQDSGFQRAWRRHGEKLAIRSWIAGPQQMQPVPAAAAWNVPRLESKAELATWLNLAVSEIEWFADLKGINRKHRDARLNHYSYRLLTKKSGKVRLIEAPKQHLRQIQRRILSQILNRIPVHLGVHGFVKNRSIRSFAAPHVGSAVILRMDIEDFFPSFPARRIQAFFRTIGYPETVADLLGGLCTNAVKFHWKMFGTDATPDRFQEVRRLYFPPHLPQGAPTSPMLANLCSYRLDCRLAGLARSAGAVYTRYADDLAFSGGPEFAARVERFSTSVAAILLESGFAVNHHKTRVMRPDVCQRLAGLITNVRLNVPRQDFDRLKAILTNCRRHGWQSQNRDAHPDYRSHLSGRIGFVESVNPAKALRLRRLFEQIKW
ncbi:MAG TPA: reverse transcriptase family protein [Terracidiphilus sp.]|nr:reverse transcriptase family protein [Terracidiphilus sp.]